MSAGTELSRVMGEAKELVFKGGVFPENVAQKMNGLSPSQKALVLFEARDAFLEHVGPEERDNVAETSGRRVEHVLVSLDDMTATLSALIGQDPEFVLTVVRGHAGEYSAVAEHITAEHIEELFAKDSLMHGNDRRSRLITLCHTLVIEGEPLSDYHDTDELEDGDAVVEFFNDYELGRQLIGELTVLAAGGDEDAQHIVRVASGRGIKRVSDHASTRDTPEVLGSPGERQESDEIVDEFVDTLDDDELWDLPVFDEGAESDDEGVDEDFGVDDELDDEENRDAEGNED